MATTLIHGEGHNRKTPEYRCWLGMRERCSNPKHQSYAAYGGRGIRVCGRWQAGEAGLSGYQCFLADMGRRPSPAHSLERVDVDGPYSPENCRWATQEEQQNNRRCTVLVWARGKQWTATRLARHLGVTKEDIYSYIEVDGRISAMDGSHARSH